MPRKAPHSVFRMRSLAKLSQIGLSETSAHFSPAGHATAKHQPPAARLDEKGIAGVFNALYPFVSLQGYRMKPIHKCRVPQQPLRRDNQRHVALGTHVLNPFRCAQILAAPMREGFLKTIQMLIGGHETEFSNHLRCGNLLVYRQRLFTPASKLRRKSQQPRRGNRQCGQTLSLGTPHGFTD